MLSFSLIAAATLLPLIVAQNFPQIVTLRVEGATTTLFEGSVSTRGRNVTTASGGTHVCDGTNLGANANARATCTTALADGAESGDFQFDGTFSTDFEDFFITSIAGQSQTFTQFWGLLHNFELTDVGGCQQQISTGDEVLWAFDAFSKDSALKISGPSTALRNVPVTLTVTDGATGAAISGATVEGQTTGANGQVSVTFTTGGTKRVKAEKTDAIRSNGHSVTVLF